jgi:DNA polymerase
VYSIFASKIYDKPISKANPIERFVGKTCILGLGFGTGAAKLQHTFQTQPPGADLTLEECEDIVKLYRSTNDKIISLWKDGDDVVKDLVDWEYTNFATNVVTSKTPYWYGEHECLQISKEGIRLPNGLYIRYPQLHLNTDEAKSYHAYKSRAGMKSIWGGALVENVVQALARIIVGEQMLLINERYKPALTVHDAAVCVVPEAELEEAEKFIVDIMSTPPLWAKGLPIACEFTSGISYGNCG